jgi:hypothetical protein
MQIRTLGSLASGIFAVMSAHSLAQVPPPPSDLRALLKDPATALPFIAQREYSLELRRAGGPRRDVLEHLLRRLYENDDPSWPSLVQTNCRAGVIDCNNYLAMVGEYVEKQDAKNPNATHSYPTIVREAYLQVLGEAGRHELYRKIMSTPGYQPKGVEMNSAEAAERALGEGMYDLVPLIESTKARWYGGSRDELDLRLQIANALMAADPAESLLELVRDGVKSDVACQLGATEYRWAMPCERPACAAAAYAIRELRRLNPPGTPQELKAILADYGVVRERNQRAWRERIEASKKKGTPEMLDWKPSPTAHLGFLGPQIARLIGDLGDRETESIELHEKTLWERVHEAETEMVKRHLVSRAETVTEAAE